MGWFWPVPQNPAQIDTHFVDKDFSLLHDLGFTFVRLPIDLASVMDASRPDLLDPDKLARIDRALDLILAHDLAVIVDLHNVSSQGTGNGDYSGNLENDPKLQETFIRFWQSFARHLSGRDPRMVYLEMMNEPSFKDHPQDWLPLQKRLLEATRQGAPRLTLIATSANASVLGTFVQMTPVADPNVIYNFHFYEPSLFTYQGAAWSLNTAVRPLRKVPYPSSPEAVTLLINSIDDPAIKADLQDYGNQRWDAAKIEQTLQQAADWGKRYHVRVICDEFGAYKLCANPADRQAWVHDVRTSLEKFGIGWSMWEYDSGFGLVERTGDLSLNPTIQVDNPLVQALGLAPIQNNP
jgi:endoglucanase